MTNNHRGKKTFRWANILLAVLLLFGLIHITSLFRDIHQMKELKAEYVAELESVQAVYDSKIEEIYLLNDDAYVARVAREKLGMVRAGEAPVVAMNSVAEN